MQRPPRAKDEARRREKVEADTQGGPEGSTGDVRGGAEGETGGGAGADLKGGGRSSWRVRVERDPRGGAESDVEGGVDSEARGKFKIDEEEQIRSDSNGKAKSNVRVSAVIHTESGTASDNVRSRASLKATGAVSGARRHTRTGSERRDEGARKSASDELDGFKLSGAEANSRSNEEGAAECITSFHTEIGLEGQDDNNDDDGKRVRVKDITESEETTNDEAQSQKGSEPMSDLPTESTTSDDSKVGRSENRIMSDLHPIRIDTQTRPGLDGPATDPSSATGDSKLQTVMEGQVQLRPGEDLRNTSTIANKEQATTPQVKDAKVKEERETSNADAYLPTNRGSRRANGADQYRYRTNLTISKPDYEDDNQVFYTCSPENVAPAKVKFLVGGDEEEDWETSRQRNSLESQIDFENGFPASRKYQEKLPARGLSLSPTGAMGRHRYGHNANVSTSSLDSSVRTPGRKRVSIELPRGIFVDHSRNSQPEMNVARSRKRVSIEEPRDRWFPDMADLPSNKTSARNKSATPDASTSSDQMVNGGILKQQSGTPRHSPGGSQDTKDVSNGDITRYRRRSQLALSPDIPVDVPLKHRQMENEVRNKNNLQFIRRRVSLQEDQKPHPGVGVHGRDVGSHPMPLSPRSFSSPVYFPHGVGESPLTPKDRPARKSGVGHLPSDINSTASNGGFSYYTRNGSTMDNSIYHKDDISIGRIGSDNDIRYFNKVTTRHDEMEAPERKSSDKEPALRHNREGSSTSSTIVVEREIDEAEIVDYLGNIQPDQRRYGFPPSPRTDRPFSVSPHDFSTSGWPKERDMEDPSDGYAVSKTLDNAEDERGDNGVDDEPSMQPYVPMKRQKISFQERHQPRQIWTLSGHDNLAFQYISGEKIS